VLLPHFAIQVEIRQHPELREQPLALMTTSGSRQIVLDASPTTSDITPGMSLTEALASCKNAVLLEAQLSRYKCAFSDTLDALCKCSPIVERAGLGKAYVGLDGLASMYGGEVHMVATILQAIPSDYVCQIGISDGKFSAYVAATKAPYNQSYRTPKNQSEFLADVSVNLLPVSRDVIRQLMRFGIDVLSQVSNVGIGPLQAQFGSTGKLIWELACGYDPRPIVPRRVEKTIVEEMSFPAPTASLEAILAGIEALLSRAFLQPVIRGRCIMEAILEGEVFRGTSWHKRITFREPIGSKNKAFTIIKGFMGSVVLTGPLENLRITFSHFTGESGIQESLLPDGKHNQQLHDALTQLEVRLGKPPPIFSVRELEPWSRIPERRHFLVPYTA
jgi:DNA polymerase-4